MTQRRLVATLGCILTAGAARGQLRSDLIESERVEKEASLTPETPPKAERRLVWAENSLVFKLLAGGVDGFGVSVGPIAANNGFALGPMYRRRDLLDGRLTFSVAARASTNQSYLGRVDLGLPSLLGGRIFTDFSAVHRNVSEVAYYGSGPDSEKTGRSNYRLEDTNFELRPGVRPLRGLRVGAIGSYLMVNVGPGQSSRYISSEQQFGPGVAPGIDRQASFLRGGGFVEYDRRDRASNPTSGARYSAQYVRFLDRDSANSSFFRLDLAATQHISIFNRTRVLTVRGASSLTNTGTSQRVPFYLQPTLGGWESLRGYRPWRFYGDNSVLVSGEHRWEVSPLLDLVAFVDAGKVFDRWSQWNLHSLESDVGFGLRFRYRTQTVFSFDTGFSHEGFQIWFRANNLY
jgi:outer membrane protein assembly factor BamA